MVNLKPHEELFEIKPIGVRYICEFCNEGEMIYKNEQPLFVEALNNQPILHHHVCNKCGNSMQLPKMYPYVEWTVPTEDKINNEK